MNVFVYFPGDVAAMYHEHRSGSTSLDVTRALSLKIIMILLLKFVAIL